MRIVFTGPKSSGKSTIGKKLAEKLNIKFIDTDKLIEEYYSAAFKKNLTFREIFKEAGSDKFREIEEKSIEKLSDYDWCIISSGGSSFLNPKNRRILRNNSIIVYIYAGEETLWNRIQKNGLPAYLQNEANPREAFSNRLKQNMEISIPYADIVVDTTGINETETINIVEDELQAEFAVRMQSANTFGEIIKITTFGESHGKALGVIMDGVPPCIDISEDDIQKELDRRKPGQSRITTARKEEDKVKILSGIFEGKTTGCPIAMIIENKDQDSSKYDNLRNIFRPGHADFTFFKKFGIRDHRGGGRSSARETVGRVASGAIAKRILLDEGIKIIAYTLEIDGIRAQNIDYDQIEKNTVRTPDKDIAAKLDSIIFKAKADGNSIGGIIQLEIKGLPAGIGDPVFGKLNARLGHALLTIGAVKGIEFGAGFEFTKMYGSQSNDKMKDGHFLTNNAGGILGGISNGEDVVIRLAVKPTPSVYIKQETMTVDGENTNIQIEGRHDPCVLPRIIPVVESMAALVILDCMEIQKRIKGE